MLLNLLSKEEKGYFIDLLSKVFMVDGDVNELEEKFLKKCKVEMGEDINKHRNSNLSFEKLVEYFSNKPKTTKNIVYYNITRISLMDEFYSVEVHETLDLLQHEFVITNKKRVELLKTIYAEKDLNEKVKRIVFE